MRRTLVISDIHGCYDEFINLLALVDFKKNEDLLLLLGDYVDRGARSKDVVEKVLQLVQGGNVIAIRGNHDQRFIDVMTSEDETVKMKFFQQGGNVIAIRGNHDQRFIDVMTSEDETVKMKFFQHGGLITLESYCGLSLVGMSDEEKLQFGKEYINKHFNHHISFLNSLPFYYEDKEHIYVHAGLNPSFENWQEQSEYIFFE
ncbi:metallophosphoesterase [Paenibacillus sp. Soil522]|uniref:metallophosphoesterase n=1 Tax=Paenibacillus sp. Soil522 TaxID=1736388 RepID=UPI0006F58004|nr:metallophosphoesterase [Paenibacillus sp. Soil522]KRE38721.1 hypothetical protein ASG81_19520 [Paenibacillus sp. Soil522]